MAGVKNAKTIKDIKKVKKAAKKPVCMLALVKHNRSYRRFNSKKSIPRSTLRELVNLARLSPSGGNMQPLKFMLVNTPSLNEQVFPHLAWAGYLKDWPGPLAGERPTAYIIILGDKTIRENCGCDHGIAAQSIMLGAAELGLGGCMIGSVNRKQLRTTLRIPDKNEILLVLALGYPRETVVLETARKGGMEKIQYWRDDRGRHHVPKRPLTELIVG